MKKLISFLIGFSILLGCGTNHSPVNTKDFSYLEYQLSDQEYAVIAVPKDKENNALAKQAALKHAAKMTLQKDFRYFIVQSQGNIVIASSAAQGGPPMPRDMYYDIIQGQGDKNLEDQYSEQSSRVSRGYRVAFICSKTKDSFQAIDACSLAACQ